MKPKTPKADPVSVCDLLPHSDSVALVPSEAQLRAEGKKFRSAIIPTGAEPWYLCKFRGVRIYAGDDAVKMLQGPGALQILGTLGQEANTNEAPAETLIKHLTGPTKRACNIIRQRHGDLLDEMFVAYCIPSLIAALMLEPGYRREQEEKARHGEMLAALSVVLPAGSGGKNTGEKNRANLSAGEIQALKIRFRRKKQNRNWTHSSAQEVARMVKDQIGVEMTAEDVRDLFANKIKPARIQKALQDRFPDDPEFRK